MRPSPSSVLWLSLLACAGLCPARAEAADALDVTFFVTSDTHVCSERDGVSPDVAKGHVWAMNSATGDGPRGKLLWPTGLPSAGTRIKDPSFVLLAGDIADDRVYDIVKPSEKNPVWGNCWNLVQELYSGWASYKKDWSSRFPVYPGFGNHDWADHDCRDEAPTCGLYTLFANRSNRVIANFIQKTAEGHGRVARSHSLPTYEVESSPPLYSWDWGRLHLVNLNTWAGEPFRAFPLKMNPNLVTGVYKDNQGWEWLQADLQAHVERYGDRAPIIIFQHYGYDDAGTSAAPRGYKKVWWSAADRQKFENIIKGYNVIVLFTGHSHAANWRQFGDQQQYLNVSAGNGSAVGGFWAVHVTDTSIEMAYVQKDGKGKSDDVEMTTDAKNALFKTIVTTPSKAPCKAGLMYLLGNDHVVAAFKVPDSEHGKVIRWKDGAAYAYRFPRCYRVWWAAQSAKCSDGTWQMDPVGMGRNAECTSYNTDQAYLEVTYP
jgi:cytolysin (calcineurin-like family phosphatase)